MFLVVPGVQVGLGLGQHIGLDDVVPGRVLAAGGARQVQRPVQHAHAGAGQLLGHARAHFGQGAFAAVDVQIGLVLVHGRIGAHAHVGRAVGQPAGDTGGARRADALARDNSNTVSVTFPFLSVRRAGRPGNATPCCRPPRSPSIPPAPGRHAARAAREHRVRHLDAARHGVGQRQRLGLARRQPSDPSASSAGAGPRAGARSARPACRPGARCGTWASNS